MVPRCKECVCWGLLFVGWLGLRFPALTSVVVHYAADH